MEKLSILEKLGISEEELEALWKAFSKFYSQPLDHKGVLMGEFEAFVVGFKLAMFLEFEKNYQSQQSGHFGVKLGKEAIERYVLR